MATVLFVSPHQDDETISMGPAIRVHLEAGHDVWVLLLTDGSASGARIKTGLSVSDFVAARDDEMRRATRALGVRPDRMIVSYVRSVDGQLTVEAAEDEIHDFEIDHPGARIKTYTDLALSGRHVDHVTVGQAARNLYRDGWITDLRLYVEPWLLSQFQAAYPSLVLGSETPRYPAHVLNALDEYQDVDTSGAKYGIGKLSVADEIAVTRARPVSRCHAP